MKRERKTKHCPSPTYTDITGAKMLPINTMVVIMTAIVSANAIEKKKRGTSQSNLDDILKYNNIPVVQIPPKTIEDLTSENLERNPEHQSEEHDKQGAKKKRTYRKRPRLSSTLTGGILDLETDSFRVL